MTLMETVVAMAILVIVLAAILPQFRCIQNSWAQKEGMTQCLQNGRIFIDHITRNLEAASILYSVSLSTNTQGYIEYIDNDGNNQRYSCSNGSIVFGEPNSQNILASCVSLLQFTCYDGINFSQAINDPNLIRVVMVQAVFQDPHNNKISQTYNATIYIRSNNLPQQGTMGPRYVFDYLTGKEPALAKIDTAHYLCAYAGYGSEGFAQVLKIDAFSQLITPSSAACFDWYQGLYPALAKIDTYRFLCAYEGWSSDGYAVMLQVNPSTWAVTPYTSYQYDSSTSYHPALAQIDATHFLCVYRGSGSYGWAVILTVNTTTGAISKGTAFRYDSYKGYNPAVIKVDTTHFLCVYRGKSDNGWAAMLVPNVAAGTITKSASLEFDSVHCDYPAIDAASATQYLCAYSGENGHGYAVLLTVNVAANTITRGPAYEFDPLLGKFPSVANIAGGQFVCAYQTKSSKGWAQVLTTNLTTGAIAKQATIPFEPGRCLYPVLAREDDKQYLCAYQGPSDDGYGIILNVDLHVVP